jgi:phage terminase large subunit-like protein
VTTAVGPRKAWAEYAAGSGIDHFDWWCRQFCIQSVDQFAGKPLVLEPWQIDFMGEVMAVNDDDSPYWGTCVLVVPRKGGKTTMLGAYADYHVDQDEGQPEVLLMASSDKQAGRLFDAIAGFTRQSAHLSERFHLRDYIGEIVRVDGGGKILRMASDPNRAHGYNPSRVVADEIHAWTTQSLRKAWAAATSAGGARRNQQILGISTAGEAADREEGILGHLIDANEAEGELEQRGALTISRNHEARVLVFNYSAQVVGKSPREDRNNFAAIRAANPASWVTDAYLKRQAASPELTDAQFLQLHGCVWAAGEGTFIAPEDWRAVGDGEPLGEGRKVCLGMDGSRTYDTTVVAWAGLAEDGRVDVDARIFSVRRDAPHHILHEGGKIDFEAVEEFVIDRFEFFDVKEAAYDPRFLDRSAEIIDRRLNDACIVVIEPQSKHMRDAIATFHRGVAEGIVRHRGDPAIGAHVSACKAEQDERGWVVSKRKHSKPIDAVPAMAMAYWRATQPQVEDYVF